MIENVTIFKDEIDAAQNLAKILPAEHLKELNTLIICSSIDSVLLVDEVAKMIELDYELLFTQPIHAPNNPKCNIAIVSENEEIIVNDELVKAFDISYDFVYSQAKRQYEETILNKIYKFRNGDLLSNLQGRNILIIDEGTQTGMTAMICIKTLIKAGAKTISYATPIIAMDVAMHLSDLTDDIYAVDRISHFIDVNSYYDNKMALGDDEIIAILKNSQRYKKLQKGDNTDAI